MCVGVLLLTAALGSGCAPSPEPTPTPTPAFASEEEAFAAAEETYRAYASATNATDLGDPRTFEPVYGWLRAEAERSARKNYSELHANEITRSGTSTFDSFEPISFENESVTAALCLDVSAVELFDATGQSIVPSDRPPRQAIEVTFVPADTTSHLAITSMVSTADIQC